MKKSIILLVLVICPGTLWGQKSVDYLLKGRALMEAGKHNEAIGLLSDAIAKASESRLYLERASLYMLIGEYSPALSDLNASNNLEPLSGEYGLAKVYALKGDIATALYHLERNLKSPFKKSEKEIMLDPSFTLVESRPEWRQFWRKSWYRRDEQIISEIEYYTSSGKLEEARLLLSELKRDYPDNEENIYAAALIELASAKYNDAVRLMSGLPSSIPGDEKYLRIMAKAQDGAGNPAGASATYSRLIDMGTPDSELLINRAGCYRKTGEITKALADIERYLDLYPESKIAISLAGKTQMAKGDNIKALEYFSRNLVLYPNDPGCYIDRANSYFSSKSWDWAAKDYSMSLDLQPGNADAWLNKGISLLYSGKTADACHDFRKSLSLGNKRATELISRNCIR